MQRIGPYEVLAELARGGMGAVYRAREPRTGTEVAIKVLHTGAKATPAQRHRFQTEVRTLGRLRHPNVVSVLDAGEHQGVPYLVMNLVQGETLQHHLDRGGSLPLQQAVRLTQALASALAHAHDAGILHRDVKPSNVILTPNGEPLLTDFGLAKDLDASQQGVSVSGAFMGTPGYWPPEQARGDPTQLGPHSDVYSLGATLYAMLVRDPPFLRDTFVLSLRATLEDDPQPLSRRRREVDRRLEAICLRCLAKDPSDRFPSAAALADALEAYLLEPAPSRGRSLRWALLALPVVAALGTGLWLAFASKPPASTSLSPQPDSPPEASVPHEPAKEEEDADFFFLRAHTKAQAGDRAGAILDIDRGLALEPDNALAYLNRGAHRAKLGELEGAREDYTRALQLDANLGDPHYNLGLLEQNAGNYPAAIAEYDMALKSIALHASLAVIHLERAVCLLNLGRSPEAIAGFDAALARDSTLIRAWSNRGVAKERTRDLPGAVDDYTQAIALDPDYVTAHFNRATVLRLLGRYAEALADLERAEALNPNDVAIYVNRGAIYAAQGEWNKVVESADQALQIAPEDPFAFTNRAAAYEELGEPSRAIDDYRRAYALLPRNHPQRARIAEALARLGSTP